MRKLYNININFTISKEDDEELRRIKDEYGFTPRSFILYVLKEIADKFKGDCKQFRGARPTAVLCREVLNGYTPFERKKNDTVTFGVVCNMPVPYSEIKQKLREAGILSDRSLIRAIIRTVIKYPELASKCRFAGIICKSYMTPVRILNYENKPVRNVVNMNQDIMEELDRIAENAGVSKGSMIANVLKILCDMEFNNSCDMIHNADIMKSSILESIETSMANSPKRVCVHVLNIKYAVQILALIEKYGIPGKQELFTRVARFIIDSANGGIQLINESIEDDEDYNETRLIRDAYRKEVTYAAHRY